MSQKTEDQKNDEYSVNEDSIELDKQENILERKNKIELPILLISKYLQSQNGMKHKDFVQYRKYCTRKLHRLRSGVKMKCGRIRYQRSYLETKDYREAKHFLILILLIERYWSFGSELGTQERSVSSKTNSFASNNRRQLRSTRKLRKGFQIANLLLEAAMERCTARTVVEVKAYRSYILGHYHMKCSEWEKGAIEFRKCLEFYQQLKLDLSFIQNISEISTLNIPILTKRDWSKIYEEQILELTPLIRLCLYHCKRLCIKIDEENFKTDQQFKADPSLLNVSNMKIFYNEKEYNVPTPNIEILLVELHESYQKVKEFFPMNDQSKILDSSTSTIIDCFSETLMYSSLLIGRIHEEITTITANSEISPLIKISNEWAVFKSYAREFNLFVSIERDMLFLLQLINYFNHSNYYLRHIINEDDEGVVCNHFMSRDFLDKKFKNTRYPEEGVRICDILSFSISEILSNGEIKNISYVTQRLSRTINNCRGLFLSHCYARNNKFQEAYLICDLVKSRLEVKEVQYNEIIFEKNGYIERVVSLIKATDLIVDDMANKSFNIYLSCAVNQERSQFSPKISKNRYIGDILEEETLKPRFTPIPVKPIMFDIASDFIAPPDLSNRTKKNGIVSKIFSSASAKFGLFK